MAMTGLSEPHIVRPDSKGRVSLGKYATGVSSFEVEALEDGSLKLVPRVEIPAREAWLFRNPEALASVRQGLMDAAEGKTVSRGSFADDGED